MSKVGIEYSGPSYLMMLLIYTIVVVEAAAAASPMEHQVGFLSEHRPPYGSGAFHPQRLLGDREEERKFMIYKQRLDFSIKNFAENEVPDLMERCHIQLDIVADIGDEKIQSILNSLQDELMIENRKYIYYLVSNREWSSLDDSRPEKIFICIFWEVTPVSVFYLLKSGTKRSECNLDYWETLIQDAKGEERHARIVRKCNPKVEHEFYILYNYGHVSYFKSRDLRENSRKLNLPRMHFTQHFALYPLEVKFFFGPNWISERERERISDERFDKIYEASIIWFGAVKFRLIAIGNDKSVNLVVECLQNCLENMKSNPHIEALQCVLSKKKESLRLVDKVIPCLDDSGFTSEEKESFQKCIKEEKDTTHGGFATISIEDHEGAEEIRDEENIHHAINRRIQTIMKELRHRSQTTTPKVHDLDDLTTDTIYGFDHLKEKINSNEKFKYMHIFFLKKNIPLIVDTFFRPVKKMRKNFTASFFIRFYPMLPEGDDDDDDDDNSRTTQEQMFILCAQYYGRWSYKDYTVAWHVLNLLDCMDKHQNWTSTPYKECLKNAGYAGRYLQDAILCSEVKTEYFTVQAPDGKFERKMARKLLHMSMNFINKVRTKTPMQAPRIRLGTFRHRYNLQYAFTKFIDFDEFDDVLDIAMLWNGTISITLIPVEETVYKIAATICAQKSVDKQDYNKHIPFLYCAFKTSDEVDLNICLRKAHFNKVESTRFRDCFGKQKGLKKEELHLNIPKRTYPSEAPFVVISIKDDPKILKVPKGVKLKEFLVWIFLKFILQ